MLLFSYVYTYLITLFRFPFLPELISWYWCFTKGFWWVDQVFVSYSSFWNSETDEIII